MNIPAIVAICVVSLALFEQLARAEGDPTLGYTLELDVVCSQGRISPQGTEMMRDLRMDVYTPTVAGVGPWPLNPGVAVYKKLSESFGIYK